MEKALLLKTNLDIKRFIKSFVLLILVLSFVCTALTVNSAADNTRTYNGLQYVIDGSNITITGYTGSNKYIYIPDSIDGRYITAIANSAFSDNKIVEYIRLPNRLTYIGISAFSYCTALKSLVIPNSVRNLDWDSGWNRGIVGGCESLSAIVMGNNISEISYCTFSDEFNKLNNIKSISVYADMINWIGFKRNSSISDVYFRGRYGSNHFEENVRYHFTDKQTYNYSVDEAYLQRYPINVIPLAKSHYKVTFKANGGKIPVISHVTKDFTIDKNVSSTYIYTLMGQQVSEEIGPTRENYEFDGWYDNPECKGEPWDFPRDKVTSNITLYAKWKPQEYKVTFDACGGKTAFSSQKYSFGLKMGNLPIARKSGYDFAGWYTRKNCGGELYDASTIMPKNSLTLYAGWIKKGTKLTIKLDANGGKCDYRSLSINFNQYLSKLPIPVFVGKKFVGWNTKIDGSGKYYTNDSTMDKRELTLYAIWEEGSYTLTLDPNGGKLSKTSYEFKYNETIKNIKMPKRNNYTFMGWYYENGTKYTTKDRMPDKDITLKAKWSGFKYMVFFDAGKGKCDKDSISVNCGEDIGELPKPKRSGYLFIGWFDENKNLYTESTEMPDNDITLYAEWKKVSEYASNITLSESDTVLGVGMTYQVEYNTVPEFTLDDFLWSSSDDSIASVDKNGLVTANKAGKAIITISGKNKKASFTVRVEKPVKKIDSAYKSRELKIGQKVMLKISYSGYAGVLKYSSSNNKVVTVDDTGCIKAVGNGKAEITVTAYNGVSVVVNITVS